MWARGCNETKEYFIGYYYRVATVKIRNLLDLLVFVGLPHLHHGKDDDANDDDAADHDQGNGPAREAIRGTHQRVWKQRKRKEIRKEKEGEMGEGNDDK